jgi:hypothetical protein
MNLINQTNIDEFGRDLTLRKTPEQRQYEEWINNLRLKMKTMSWAEMEWEAEEEEELRLEEEKRIHEEIERIKFQVIAKQRLQLLAKGNYELEEGELLE